MKLEIRLCNPAECRVSGGLPMYALGVFRNLMGSAVDVRFPPHPDLKRVCFPAYHIASSTLLTAYAG